jgi:hypothetical protein
MPADPPLSAALKPPPPPLHVAMGNCFSNAAPAGAAVHASEALPAPAAGKPHTKPGAVPPPRAAKRGAVGQADTSAAAADTVDNLPHHEKTAAEKALIVAAIKDNILFRVRKGCCWLTPWDGSRTAPAAGTPRACADAPRGPRPPAALLTPRRTWLSRSCSRCSSAA